MKKLYRISIYALLLLWLLAVVCVMFINNPQPKFDEEYTHYLLRNIGIIPFGTTQSYIELICLDKINIDIVVRNIAGNLVMFVPLGFLLPYIFDKLRNYRSMAGFAAAVAFVLEVVQLLTMSGRFDIDDIILRCFGALFGLFSTKILMKFISTIRTFKLKTTA